MSIWVVRPSLDEINELSSDNMLGHLGIRFIGVTDDSIQASMPVDSRTKQPYGILHGGASVVLAETLASVAANYTIDRSKNYSVGLDVNANHIRSVRSGIVVGTATAIHIGRSTQVWEVRILAGERLASIHRITMAILSREVNEDG